MSVCLDTECSMSKIIVYTDGSAINRKDRWNSGHGGCGYVAKWRNAQGKIRSKKSYFGRIDNTTSARMEILAAIKSLEEINTGFNIVLHIDNKYVQEGILYKWYERWLIPYTDTMSNNIIQWNKDIASNPNGPKNLDLWMRLREIYSKHISEGSIIESVWIKGHADGKHILNEVADDLAFKGRTEKHGVIDNRKGIYLI